MPTIQIITRNNEDTVGRTLDSLSGLGARVIVGDLGSTDSTLEICLGKGAEILKIKWEEDYSKVRNSLSAEGMNMYLEPWEVLARGHEFVSEVVENCRIYVINGKMVSKELRIWKDAKFQNPIYESIQDETAVCVPEIVVSSVGNMPADRRRELSSINEKWIKSSPTSPDPYYYMAMSRLAERNYRDFFMFSRQYLAMSKKFTESTLMLNYYMAQVELHVGEIRAAANNLAGCLCLRPEMAEFWCLLGDILYKSGDYSRSKCMYENAMIIGKRRKKDDIFPIEITKYREYPSKMIQNIKEIEEHTELVGSKIYGEKNIYH